MTKTTHRIYIILLATIVVASLIILLLNGISYYRVSLENRFFHPSHSSLKPSGVVGHGLGILGSLFMLIGVASYMIRKRWRYIARLGLLKHWLEFHIFLCSLGPILVLFHTSFKFGGIVAISFWSMVAVFLSGIIGRFIYIQIPRTIEGRELSLNEMQEQKTSISKLLADIPGIEENEKEMIIDATNVKSTRQLKFNLIGFLSRYKKDQKTLSFVKKILKKSHLPKSEKGNLTRLIRNELSLNRRIERLVLMQKLFKYWHVAHLPFAIVMLIIMIVHVSVTLIFGFKWIF